MCDFSCPRPLPPFIIIIFFYASWNMTASFAQINKLTSRVDWLKAETRERGLVLEKEA